MVAESYECLVWPDLKGLSWVPLDRSGWWFVLALQALLMCWCADAALGENPITVGSSEGGCWGEKYSCPSMVQTGARVNAHGDLYWNGRDFSLVSWLCWESLCALSKMPAQQENVVGMGIWIMASLPYQQWNISDRRQFHVGNAAVAVGDTALNEE